MDFWEVKLKKQKKNRLLNGSKRGKYEKNLSKNNSLFFDDFIILEICE